MKPNFSKEYLTKQLSVKSYVQIAKENHVDTSTIQRYMRRYGLTKKRVSWTRKEIRLLEKQYEFNPNIYAIFSGRSRSAINHKASKFGLKKILRKRKYYLNHWFFDTWTPEMAYVLGLFLSDGNVSFDRKQAGIHFCADDYTLLEQVNRVMGSNRPVRIYSNCSYLRFDSPVLCASLIKRGCVPRKSLKLDFPDVPQEFLSHFVRGYFDGDGSIHFNKPNTIKISFLGTKLFLDKLQSRLGSALKMKPRYLTRIKSIWRFYVYGDDARALCAWMYKNSKGLYLERKRFRFDTHMRSRKNG